MKKPTLKKKVATLERHLRRLEAEVGSFGKVMVHSYGQQLTSIEDESTRQSSKYRR